MNPTIFRQAELKEVEEKLANLNTRKQAFIAKKKELDAEEAQLKKEEKELNDKKKKLTVVSNNWAKQMEDDGSEEDTEVKPKTKNIVAKGYAAAAAKPARQTKSAAVFKPAPKPKPTEITNSANPEVIERIVSYMNENNITLMIPTNVMRGKPFSDNKTKEMAIRIEGHPTIHCETVRNTDEYNGDAEDLVFIYEAKGIYYFAYDPTNKLGDFVVDIEDHSDKMLSL